MANTIPPKLNKVKEGKIIYSFKNENADEGFSFIGTKTFVFTDFPGIYYHDTGKILGDEVIKFVKKENVLKKGDYFLANKSESLLGRIDFSANYKSYFLISGQNTLKKIINGLFKKLHKYDDQNNFN